MPWKQLKTLREKRGETQKAMKAILDTAETENRDLTAEEGSKFDELSGQANGYTADIQRFEQLDREERAAADDTPDPGRHDVNGKPETRSDEGDAEKRAEEQRAAFQSCLRNGIENLSPEQRNLLTPGPDAPAEVRAMAVSGAGGFGVVGNRLSHSTLIQGMKGFTGVREAGATVIRTQNGNEMTVPKSDDTANVAQLIGENPSTGASAADATVGNAPLNAFTFSSGKMGVSFQLLQDADFDIEAIVYSDAAQRIGRLLNTHTTTGDGSGKPLGFVAAATGNRHEAGGNGAMAFDDLLDLKDTVDYAYHGDPTTGYMMHQATLTEAQKLKDDQGRPIWTPAMGDKPERIHGYPVTLNNDLAQFGAAVNSVVAAFGCWKKYFIRDVTREHIVRDPFTLSDKGLISFIVFSRHGGTLTDTKAIGLLDLPAAA